MLVYLVPNRNTRFHRVADCPYLRSDDQVVSQELTIDMLHAPCRVCWPDQPIPQKIWRPYCPTCNLTRTSPCEHNGGVLVDTAKYLRASSRPGWETDRVVLYPRWVWPENVPRIQRRAQELLKRVALLE